MANLCFIVALNSRSREEHFPNKCPLHLHCEYHNFPTTISTRSVKGVFEKSLNCSGFFAYLLHTVCIFAYHFEQIQCPFY